MAVYTEFADDGKLREHLARHLDEFPGFTAEDYAERAAALLNAEPGGDILGFLGRNGRVYRYHQTTNEYAVGSGGGKILTLFKPGEGISFWEEKYANYGKPAALQVLRPPVH